MMEFCYRPNLISALAYLYSALRKTLYPTPTLFSGTQKISVNRTCHGGYPSNTTRSPNMISKSGSPMTDSVISASMSSWLISEGESLPSCDMLARVRVRSTRVWRPSVAERRRIVRCG